MADAEGSVWVVSEMVGSSYKLIVRLEPHLEFTLTPDEGIAYLTELYRVANMAEHDAAVLKQFSLMGLPIEASMPVLIDVRKDRPSVNTEALGGIEMQPGVTKAGKAFVHCKARGQDWQWDPADLRQHAHHILDVMATVDLDETLRRTLRGVVDLDAQTTSAFIASLAEIRQAPVD